MRNRKRPLPSPVYPRVCGGTPPLSFFPFFLRGLSPRVRGNQDLLSEKYPSMRSIPACAGEPACRSHTT